MGILHKLADGSVEVRENYDLRPFSTEADRSTFILAMTEAAKDGKRTKLIAKIAAMPEGVTRNKTFYPIDELERSLATWTNPYPCPVIKDHNEWEVDGIVGRINEAYIAADGANKALWFEVSILDPDAQEKVASGLWAQVSIGTRVNSAVCSICGNDWAKGTWCEHERGNHYCKDPEDPSTLAECYWIMGGVQGREVSFVTTPSAAGAGVRSVQQAKASEAELVIDSMALMAAGEDELEQLRAFESVRHGSPSVGLSDGEANVPSSEKEEGMPAEAKEAEVIETEAPSDVTTEGEESVETPEETEELVDGQDTEETEGTEDAAQTEDEGSESESEETTSEDELDPTTEESDEAAEAEAEGQDGEEGEVSERDQLLATIADLNTQILGLKAQLYVESGLRDGILAGERDALVEAHMDLTEASLDDLIGVMAQRRSNVSVSEQILAAQVASPAERVHDDDNADEKEDTDLTEVHVETETGSRVFRIKEDNEPVIVTPKLQ